MNHLPLVTIAIPTYNRAESYFPQTLKSALQQTCQNLEIVVSDNCSKDRTPALVAGIADPRLRYVQHSHNIGQRKNYNFCFETARGRYVLLLHDDDIIDADFVEACIAAAGGTSDAGIIRTGVRIIDAEGNISHQIPDEASGLSLGEFFRSWFSSKAPIYCCNTLFNTERLRAVGGFESKYFIYPDAMAIFRLAAGHPRIDISDVKASFRVHGNEVGFSKNISEWCEESLDLLRLMCELAPQSRDEILKEGRRFLATANYHRASCAHSPLKRAVAMLKVLRYFGYRHLPSARLLLHIGHGTRVYNTLRFLKRQAVRPFRTVTAG